MRWIAGVGAMLCVVGTSTGVAADETRQRCEQCPRVTLVSEADLVHVVSEDDRDDPEDLFHRLRFVIDGEPTEWTDWNRAASYEVRTDVTATVEAESRDLEGFVGTGVIQLDRPEPEEESIGPDTVAENGREDQRWSDDATTPDDGSRPAEPDIAPADVTYGDTPWDVTSHGECPPTSCNTTPTAPASWPTVALLLLVSAGLLTRGRIPGE